MAHKIIERVQAHYEVHEVPFGKIYEWHPAYATLECDCAEKLTLSVISPITTCPRCGADLSVFLYDITKREGEGRLQDKLTHPWFYDAKEQTEQHQHDEATHPEGSPWRYNDITEGP
jgi:hypothetical protein